MRIVGDERLASLDRAVIWGLAALALIGLILMAFPQIDLLVSRLAFDLDGAVLTKVPTVVHLQRGIRVLSWIVGASLVLGVVITSRSDWQLLGLTYGQWAFLSAVPVFGPGPLANSIMEDHWHRARPHSKESSAAAPSFPKYSFLRINVAGIVSSSPAMPPSSSASPRWPLSFAAGDCSPFPAR